MTKIVILSNFEVSDIINKKPANLQAHLGWRVYYIHLCLPVEQHLFQKVLQKE